MDESHSVQFVKDSKATKTSMISDKKKNYIKTTFNIIFLYVLGLQVSSFFNNL